MDDSNDIAATPGGPAQPYTPGAGFDREKATRLLDEAFEAAVAIKDKLQAGISGRLEPLKTLCAELQAKQTGTIGVTLDRLSSLCAKLEKKVQGRIGQQLGTVYGYMQSAGMPLPTPEQVQYYAATKDIDGAISIVPGAGIADHVGPVAAGDGVASPLPTPAGTTGVGLPDASSAIPGASGGQPVTQPTAGTDPRTAQPIPVAGGPPPGMPTSFEVPPGQGCPDGYALSNLFGTDRYFCSWTGAGGGAGGGQPPAPGTPVPNPTGPTPPGGTGGDCPPGYHFEPADGPADNTLGGIRPPIVGGDDGKPILMGGRSETSGPCFRGITGGVHQTFPGYGVVGPDGANVVPPWFQGSPGVPPGLYWHYSISGDYFAPPLPGVPVLEFPAGFVLYYRPEDGTIYASNKPLPGYVEYSVASEWPRCSPTQPPPGSPGTPGGSGGSCVPNSPCPTPTPPTCGPEIKLPRFDFSGGTDDWCDTLNRMSRASDSVFKDADKWLGIGEHGGPAPTGVVAAVIAAITGGNTAVIPAIGNRFIKWLRQFVENSALVPWCNGSSLVPVAWAGAAINFVDKLTGAMPPQVKSWVGQLGNYICQHIIMSVPDAHKAFLAAKINEGDWACYVKAGGEFVNQAKKVMEASRTRPNVREIIDLYRRKKIDDKEFNDRLRGEGVIDDKEAKHLYDLSEQFPTFSDIIRLMVRDAFNDEVATAGELDKGFAENYTDRAKELGFAAGVPDELAKLLWRAHWEIPSYTQLREMVFRLRPGEVDAKLAVDIPAMEKALMQDDYAPGWVRRLIEIAYHPLTRTDAIDMYMLRQSSDEKLVGDLMDGGYKKEIAQRIQGNYKARRKIREYRDAGYPSMIELVRLYGECLIDPTTFSLSITNVAPTEEHALIAQEAAELRREVHERKQLIRTIQKEYRLGLIDDTEAARRLNEEGIDPTCIPGLVRRMAKHAQRQPKQLPASQLCKLREYGLVTERQHYEGLLRMGYDGNSAMLSVQLCNAKIAEALQKEIAKAEKAAAAAAKKAGTAAKKK